MTIKPSCLLTRVFLLVKFQAGTEALDVSNIFAIRAKGDLWAVTFKPNTLKALQPHCHMVVSSSHPHCFIFWEPTLTTALDEICCSAHIWAHIRNLLISRHRPTNVSPLPTCGRTHNNFHLMCLTTIRSVISNHPSSHDICKTRCCTLEMDKMKTTVVVPTNIVYYSIS